MPEVFGVALNKITAAISSYQGFNFKSIAKMDGNDIVLGANENGLYEIGGNVDEGTGNILCLFETMRTDFGISNVKQIRSVMLTGEFSDDFLLSVKVDEQIWHDFRAYPRLADPNIPQHSVNVPIGNRIFGVFWEFKVTNIDGGHIAVDRMEAVIIDMARKPR